ncbi:hypothetical protein ABEO76_21030 [Bacillus anthracis]|uniref:hypothetical protein n=1 Tax=Bacillus anthracis TaxID=1392 RepID=UPI003D1CB9E8
MTKTIKRMEFNAKFYEVEEVNPQFSRAKCRVMYTGDNFNKTIINKDAVEKALPSIYNIPVVGEFSTEKEDFKGHGGKIEITEDDYRMVHTTVPYGVVPESAKVYWEEVEEKNGKKNDYLCIEGIYLWTGRYPEAKKVVDEGKGQSMEIDIKDGKYVSEKDMYDITNFNFQALCILGDDVRPCFESADIKAYSLDRDRFKDELAEMLGELKFSLKLESEETEVSEVKCEKCTQEECICETVEETVVEEVATEEVTEETVEAVEVVEEVQEEKIEETQEAETETEEVTEVVAEEEVVEVQETIEETVEPVVEEVVTEEAVEEVQEVDYQALYTEARAELERVTTERDNLLTSNTELETFKASVLREKHEASVRELIRNEEFASLEQGDIQDLIDSVHEYSLEQIQSKLYERVGKKLAKFSLQNKTRKDKSIVTLEFSKEENANESKSAYGGLFDKHLSK